MTKQELNYGGCKIIADKVEINLLDINFKLTGEDFRSFDIVQDVADDFLDYLERSGLEDYWSDYEIIPLATNTTARLLIGVKFVFLRLVAPKNESAECTTMGGGTQWVSDVIDLMKGFVTSERERDIWDETDNYTDVKLVFRIENKQFEWK